MTEEIRFLIYFIIILSLSIYSFYYMNKHFIKIKIHEIDKKNQINFLRLQKQYLTKINDSEIEDLIIFLYQYLQKQKGNKK